MVIPDYRTFKHSNELYHYGMPRRSGRYPYGSGKRPYQSINSSALSVYKIANDKEKAITKDIKEVAKMSNCKLYGLENRLKTIDSIQRKISKKQIEDGKTEKESIDIIHDSVRYTTISENKDFVSNYELFKKNMSDRGYTEIECKNYFDLFNKGIVKHKAVQSQFSTRDGFIFEVQFQTPESQDAKTKKIPLYEERRKVGIDAKRAKELENEMEKLALKVPDPPGIEKIKSHSKSSSDDKLKEINKIHSSLSEKDKYFIGESPISEYTKYSNTKDGAYIILDDYDGKFKDEHPYEGLIVSIAASPKARGTGATDKLIEEAKRKNLNNRLIAEIDSDNTNSRRLFERNGFKKMDSFSDIDFYYWDKNLKHSQEGGVNFKMNEFYYIAHGGPGSGRYPLGSGERPYQRRKTSRGIGGYIRYRRAVKAEDKALRKEEKEYARLGKDIKRSLERAREGNEYEAEKARVLREGTATEVLRYQGDLTNKELEEVNKRLDFESKIRAISQKEISSHMQKIDRMMNSLKVGTGWVSIGMDTYNTVAAIYNATDKGAIKPLRKINKNA